MSETNYRISVVSSLTNIPAATIRMWEHRYGAVKPGRTEGKMRLYTRDDVDRLSMLKAAVDAGHAISMVAVLDDAKLKVMLDSGGYTAQSAPARRLTALVCGGDLASRLSADWAEAPEIEIRDRFENSNDIEFEISSQRDVIIFDLPYINTDILATIRRIRNASKAKVTMLVYGVASRKILEEASRLDMIALTAPIPPKQILQICLNAYSRNFNTNLQRAERVGAPARGRRYDDIFIAKLAQVDSDVVCECPNHIADVIAKLVAFERYSQNCESKNPKDEVIHSFLQDSAARCIEILEEAVDFLLEHENIELT